MTAILVLMVGLLPASRPKNVLLSVLGWSVARSARIHTSVFWGLGRVTLGERAIIGYGNVFRQLAGLDLADDAGVGQFNWITAEARYADQSDPARAATLVLHDGASIASRHYLDCAGGVEIGRMSILAGVRSTILSHWADHQNWVLRAAPVVVGTATIVSSAVTLTAGASVPDGCIVGAGAVVPKALPEPNKLYGGVPARAISDITGSAHAHRSAARFSRPGDTVRVDSGAGPS